MANSEDSMTQFDPTAIVDIESADKTFENLVELDREVSHDEALAWANFFISNEPEPKMQKLACAVMRKVADANLPELANVARLILPNHYYTDGPEGGIKRWIEAPSGMAQPERKEHVSMLYMTLTDIARQMNISNERPMKGNDFEDPDSEFNTVFTKEQVERIAREGGYLTGTDAVAEVVSNIPGASASLGDDGTVLIVEVEGGKTAKISCDHIVCREGEIAPVWAYPVWKTAKRNLFD